MGLLARPYPTEEHQARLILGDPVAEAWQWIYDYSVELRTDMDALVYAAVFRVNAWTDHMLPERVDRSLSGIRIKPEFWDRYEFLTGQKFSKHSRKPSFS